MPQLKRFTNFKGLDLKRHAINVDGSSASDTENCQLTDKGELEKREGYALEANTAGQEGVTEYVADNQLVTMENTAGEDYLRRLDAGSMVLANRPFQGVKGGTGRASFAEWNGILYIAREGTWLRKYDGKNLYAAGVMPTQGGNFSVAGGSIPAGTYDYLIETEHANRELRGDVVKSDYVTFSQTYGVASRLTFSLNAGGITFDFGMSDIAAFNAGALQSSSVASIVFTVQAGHTVTVGDWLFCRTGTNLDEDPWYLYEVTATTATSITLANPELRSLHLRSGDMLSSTIANIYRLDPGSGSYNYIQSSAFSVSYVAGTATPPLITDNAASAVGLDYVFPDDKLFVSPKCKYVTSHQGVLVLGNGSFSYEPFEQNFQKDERQAYTIYWSATRLLDSVEMFSSTNSLVIGTSDEGEITGLAVNNDILVVFKERAIYYVSGNFITNSLRVEKSVGGEIGCSSHHTIKEINDVLFFLNEKTFYALRAGSIPYKAGEPIEPLIKSGGYSLSDAVSVHNYVKEQYACFIPHPTLSDIVLVYDYDYQAWFKWVGIDAPGGLVEYNDDNYFVDSSARLQKFSSTRSDDPTGVLPVEINAYYTSSFEDMGDPGIRKKPLNVRAYSLNSTSQFDLQIRSFKDYDTVNELTNTTITLGPTLTEPFKQVKFKAGQNNPHAFTVEFRNNTVGQNMNISAWEIQYETPYGRMKGDF